MVSPGGIPGDPSIQNTQLQSIAPSQNTSDSRVGSDVQLPDTAQVLSGKLMGAMRSPKFSEIKNQVQDQLTTPTDRQAFVDQKFSQLKTQKEGPPGMLNKIATFFQRRTAIKTLAKELVAGLNAQWDAGEKVNSDHLTAILDMGSIHRGVGIKYASSILKPQTEDQKTQLLQVKSEVLTDKSREARTGTGFSAEGALMSAVGGSTLGVVLTALSNRVFQHRKNVANKAMVTELNQMKADIPKMKLEQLKDTGILKMAVFLKHTSRGMRFALRSKMGQLNSGVRQALNNALEQAQQKADAGDTEYEAILNTNRGHGWAEDLKQQRDEIKRAFKGMI